MTLKKTLRLLVLPAFLVSSHALATDYFGAMAYCPETQATSWSRNYQSRSGAETRALDECKELGGKKCQVLVWFKNACGAMAKGPGGAGSGWGTTEDRAKYEAMLSCTDISKKCRIKHIKCTEGYDE